jgi:hypothetical protein
MPVVPIKTELRCKICKSDFRTEIDALLEQRSNRESDEQGNRINLQYVQEKMIEYGVKNPTLDNVNAHWKNHCEVGSAEAITAAQSAQLDALEELLAGGEHANLDEALRTIVTLGVAGFREKVAKGMNPITVDHVLKAAAELTRRSHNEAQQDLLTSLIGGIGQALGPGKMPKQIEGAEVIDAPDYAEEAA